ncbi:MAG: glycoside hydrolase [Blastocatellia bacterium]|nr:glycoside hydrolase [Blastocatellia bacterium]
MSPASPLRLKERYRFLFFLALLAAFGLWQLPQSQMDSAKKLNSVSTSPQVGGASAGPESQLVTPHATLVVTSTADTGAGSLRDTITTAVSGDIITFNLTLPATITLASEIAIANKNLTINGPDLGFVTISGGNATRLFNISGTSNVSFSQLTFSGGSVTGTSSTQVNGGAILHAGTGTIAFANCTLSSNTITGFAATGSATSGAAAGAAIANTGGGTVTSSLCTFSSNTTTGGSNSGSGGPGDAFGGAIYQSSGTLTLTSCTFTSNTCTGGQGSNSRNGQNGNGGAVQVTSGNATITGCTFSANIATGGSCANATAGQGNGGAFSCTGGSTNMVNCTVSGNTASGGTPTSNGGGATKGNGNGGGVNVNSTGTLTLTGCTVANNSATQGNANANGNPGAASGGGMFRGTGTLNFGNTIVAGNTLTAGTTVGPDINGSVNSNNYNLIQTTAGAAIGGTTTNNITGTDPLLRTLADNGGPTQTRLPAPTSAVINAGNPVGPRTTDQRGYAGQIGTAVDIGAVEVSYSLVITGGSPQATDINTAFPNALAATVRESSVNFVSGISVGFTAPGAGASCTFFTNPAISGANGVASSVVIANGTTGSYTVTGAITGTTISVTYSLTNRPAGCTIAAAGSNNAPAIGGALQVRCSITAGTATGVSVSGPNGYSQSTGVGGGSVYTFTVTTNFQTVNTGTYTFTVSAAGGCVATTATQVVAFNNPTVSVDVPTVAYTTTPPTNPATGGFGTFYINTFLRNTSGTNSLFEPIYFQVTNLSQPTYYLDSRTSGAAAPADATTRQSVSGTIAPGGFRPVTFRIALPSAGRSRFGFFVDLYCATNASPRAQKQGTFEFVLTPKAGATPTAEGDLSDYEVEVRQVEPNANSTMLGGSGAQVGARLAVDPANSRRQALAATDFGKGTVRVKYTDDGVSWRESTLSQTVNGVTYDQAFDPAVTFDGNGNLLVSYVVANSYDNASAVVLSQRLFDRLTFSNPVALTTRTQAENVAFARTALAAKGGRPYVAWEENNLAGGSIRLYDLAARRNVEVARGNVSHPTLAVLADGGLAIGWNDHDRSTLQCRTGATSATLSAETVIAATHIGNGAMIPAMADVAAKASLQVVAHPQQANVLYATYADLSDGMRVFFTRSQDGGQTWEKPTPVGNLTGGEYQFLPTLATDGTTVAVAYYGTQLDQSGQTVHVWLSRSTDNGKTFGPAQQITTTASNLSASNPNRLGAVNFGEYIGVTVRGKDGISVAWTDTSNGTEDIFFGTVK